MMADEVEKGIRRKCREAFGKYWFGDTATIIHSNEDKMAWRNFQAGAAWQRRKLGGSRDNE
jgi:hypothetical protein